MTTLESLPDELVARITDFLDKRGLAEARLVNKRLERLSVAKLFRRISLYAHWKKGYDEEAYSGDTPRDRFGYYEFGGELLSPTIVEDELELPPSTVADDEVDVVEAWEEHQPSSREPSAPIEQALAERFQEALQERHDLQSRRASAESVISDVFEEDDSEPAGSGPIDLFGGDEDEWYLPSRRGRDSTNSEAKPQWALDHLPGPPGYDAHSYKCILQHDTLSVYAREIQVYTCETHCDHHPSVANRLYEESMPPPNFHPIFHECIRRLGEFPNIHNITIHFDRHVSHADYDEDVFQHQDFQRKWL